jgi:hypothetical protein
VVQEKSSIAFAVYHVESVDAWKVSRRDAILTVRVSGLMDLIASVQEVCLTACLECGCTLCTLVLSYIVRIFFTILL